MSWPLALMILLAGAPDPAKEPVVQTIVEAKGPSGPLKGTFLSRLDTKDPVVLIIPGSGPTDRDGDSPLGLKASTYRLLAEGLVQRGIASARIDKRGMFASAGAVANANDVTLDAYAEDARSWIEAIRRVSGAPCVWVLGHSEGGLVALLAAKRANDVCGLILVSTAGRPMGEVLAEQIRANPANAPLQAQADAAISALEAGRRVDVSSLHPALRSLFAPAVQGFLINAFSYDPQKLIRSYPGPVLILQGAKDIQVSIADAERLKSADPRARIEVLEGVNHVLKSVASDSRADNLATYSAPDLPLAPGVVATIADFIEKGR